MYKLIKLQEGYIIVSDEEITFMDTMKPCYYLFENKVYKREYSHHKDGQKIIASNFIPELPSIDFNNLEEEFGIIDVNELAISEIPLDILQTSKGCFDDLNEPERNIWKNGFNKCLSLNKDKLYTLEDIDMAYIQGSTDGSGIGNKRKMRIEYLQSLQPKTEWNIEVEMNSCSEDIGICALGCIGNCKPKITNNQIKIINIL